MRGAAIVASNDANRVERYMAPRPGVREALRETLRARVDGLGLLGSERNGVSLKPLDDCNRTDMAYTPFWTRTP